MIIVAKQIFVTGHKNPDTDSICSSIAYAKLKQLQGINAAPIRAGEPNKETAFALNYFNVTPQPLVKDFYVKVGEAVYSDVEGLAINASLKDAAKWFTDHESDVAPVVDNGQFVGVIEKAQLADQFIKTVMGEELSTVKGLVHDPELVFSPNDCGHDVPEKGRYAVVENGKYVGMVCASSIASVEKQQVILVDHNEKKQIIDGIDEASIVGVIDHHRIGGTLATDGPISILFKTVGCTATIVTGLYEQAGIANSKRRRRTPPFGRHFRHGSLPFADLHADDREAAEKLANIAGVDIEKYGMEMLKAGANVSDLTPDQIVHNDMKEFTGGDATFTVAQVQVMDTTDLLNQKQVLLNALEKLRAENGYVASFLMITSIIDESTNLIFAGNMDEAVSSAFGKDVLDKEVYLPKVMSRKKQVIPPILSAMK